MERSILDIQKILVPDLLASMQNRFRILQAIQQKEPIGRRGLADTLGLSERVVRGEVEFLKKQQLIHIGTSGMTMTTRGRNLLMDMEEMMRSFYHFEPFEKQLQTAFGISKVVVVPGDSDEKAHVKEELGKACANLLSIYVTTDHVIAVTGGTTMAAVANMLTPETGKGKNLLFVPARGGVGQNLTNQANTICSLMAENTGGRYRVLFVPHEVSYALQESLMREPQIKEVLRLIQSADLVLHGIGDAIKMAKRRKTDQENLQKIIEGKAVGEAFGYYFNEKGEIVHKVPTIGLQFADLKTAKHIIAVAGGKSKAKAIQAYMKRAPDTTVLITDEAAAHEMMKDYS